MINPGIIALNIQLVGRFQNGTERAAARANGPERRADSKCLPIKGVKLSDMRQTNEHGNAYGRSVLVEAHSDTAM
jgi:hypothetical protein